MKINAEYISDNECSGSVRISFFTAETEFEPKIILTLNPNEALLMAEKICTILAIKT